VRLLTLYCGPFSPTLPMQIRDPRLTGVCLACERPIASRRSAWRPLQHQDDAIVHCSDCARFLEGYFSITFVKDRGYLWVAWASLFRCQNGENPVATGCEPIAADAQMSARRSLSEQGYQICWQGSAHSARSYRRRESLIARPVDYRHSLDPQPPLDARETSSINERGRNSRRVA
jgi:hypothetical protein